MAHGSTECSGSSSDSLNIAWRVCSRHKIVSKCLILLRSGALYQIGG
jgi:hypothetical protein